MRKSITMVVAVVLIAAMAGLLIWQRNIEPEVEEAHEPFRPDAIIERGEIDLERVTFINRAGETTVMVREPQEEGRDEWTVEGSEYLLDFNATRNKIRGGFALFANQVLHEDIRDVPDLNLADFGLDPPYMIIESDFFDGTNEILHLGSPTPDLRGYFIRVEGNPGLFVITSVNGDRFMMGMEDLIDRSILNWELETMGYFFAAERGREPVEFAYDAHPVFEDVTWLVMRQPFPDRDIQVSSFEHLIWQHLTQFRLGNLVTLHAEDLAYYGLDDPSLEFIFGDLDDHEDHLLFGDRFTREIGGSDVEFIYVKFAGRPHVFEARFEPVSVLFNMNSLRFIDRFIALINIVNVDRITITTSERTREIHINPVGDAFDIEPTIDAMHVNDGDFRRFYQLIVGLGIDAEIDPITPDTEPEYVINFFLREGEGDDVELRLFTYDANFMGVSINGRDINFITNRRNVNLIPMYLEAFFEGVE